MATIYSDIYGSFDRRRKQDEKDAAELEKPVRSVLAGYPAPENSRLALRPVLERLLAAQPRHKTEAEQFARHARKMFKRGQINKAQMRAITNRHRVDVVAYDVAGTLSAPARNTRFNRRLARRKAKASS